MTTSTNEFSVASLNLHSGVDGWGRPFDVVESCRALDADVLVLQESWMPETGPSLCEQVGATLGYQVREEPLAAGRLAAPARQGPARWTGPLGWAAADHSLFLDGERPLPPRLRRAERYRSARPGHWSLGVLTRLPILHQELIDLGKLEKDRAHRRAIVLWLRVDGGGTGVEGETVAVVGTHLSHLTQGSPVQFRRLARALKERIGQTPAVLAGDMNLWGPPLLAFFPGWRRAVRGRTWPSWRPHSQLDHLLVRGLVVREAEVRPHAGSDHRPVFARLAVADRSP